MSLKSFSGKFVWILFTFPRKKSNGIGGVERCEHLVKFSGLMRNALNMSDTCVNRFLMLACSTWETWKYGLKNMGNERQGTRIYP